MKWKYKEFTQVLNVLQFITTPNGLIEISFDLQNQPHIRPIAGAPCQGGIPKEDEPILLAQIHNQYPNGFHSRYDSCWLWVKERLEELAAKHSIVIKSFSAHGCLMVDGRNRDAYRVEVKHENITSPIYVALTSYKEEFVVFRPYIQFEEELSTNIHVFEPESEPIFSSGEAIFFQDEIVSVKSYQYRNGNILKADLQAFKNNTDGFIYESKYGKFMASSNT